MNQNDRVWNPSWIQVPPSTVWWNLLMPYSPTSTNLLSSIVNIESILCQNPLPARKVFMVKCSSCTGEPENISWMCVRKALRIVLWLQVLPHTVHTKTMQGWKKCMGEKKKEIKKLTINKIKIKLKIKLNVRNKIKWQLKNSVLCLANCTAENYCLSCKWCCLLMDVVYVHRHSALRSHGCNELSS